MGAAQSNASNAFVEALQRKQASVIPTTPNVPPDPREQREKKRVELTMARNDVVTKQNAYDVVAPDEASQRKIDAAKAANNKYLTDITTQFTYETRLLNQSINQAEALSNSATLQLAQKYTKTLEKRYVDIEHDNIKNKEKIFTNRRRFLDADPQSGVPGIGGYQTVDEQVLLAFWVTYFLFASVVVFYILDIYKARFENIYIMIGAGVGAVIALAFCAHMAIRYFCTK